MTRVALITGGARGIGRAVGIDLAERGWSIGLCYRNSADAAVSACAEIAARGATALGVQCDVSDPDACALLVERVTAELGPIEALIHCAGPYQRVPYFEETLEGWHAMFDNNLHPLFYLSRLVGPGMTERGRGRIIAFSMANAERLAAQPHITAHYIAKAGLLVLVRTLAKLLGPHGITVNAISPGFIDSGSAPADELAKMVKHIPAGYIGELSDAVGAVRYLLSDEARYVNGANLTLSGGWGL